jgi:hypothetical protein
MIIKITKKSANRASAIKIFPSQLVVVYVTLILDPYFRQSAYTISAF